jgi:hypothetical protein
MFGAGGRVTSQGSISELVKRGSLATQIREDQKILDKTQEEIDSEDPIARPAEGKLIVAEELQEGHVNPSACQHSLVCSSR